uniref:Saposin B-type domain-containing protein n=1 Tax=Hyaloperonospora arabidopsidis (strain Emoy2) TaxID=559515 RepID=M4BAK8_HYAAE
MRPRNALLLLLGLATALALASAEDDTYAVHNGTDAETPFFGADESDPSAGLGEALQSLLQAGEPEETVDIVRIIMIDEEDPAAASKRACSKALTVIAEQDELFEQADSLLRDFESAFGLDSPKPQSRASCEDLGLAELMAQCEFVVESKDMVLQLSRQGRTEDQVCDVMNVVSDLKAVDTLSCGLCHRLVQMVTQALTNEVQQVEQVREIIGDVCDVTLDDSMCHTFLNKFDDIVEWLRHDTDPVVVCLRLAMCPVDRLSKNGTPILDWFSGDEARRIADEAAATRDTQEWNSFSDIETPSLGLIFGDEARKSAGDAVDAGFSEQGNSVSDSEFTSNLDLIFGLEARRTADEGIATSVFEQQEQSCSFCMSTAGVITQVNSRFPDQVSMTKDLLKSVCRTASPVSKCQEVEANFDRILELMQQGHYPREVCGRIDLCTQQVTSNKACVYCDAATTLVEVILQEAPEQINEIRNYADMICDILGDDSPCHEDVAKLDAVIDSLNKGERPREVCKALKYCSEDFSGKSGESLRVDMTRNDPFGNNRLVRMGDGGMYSDTISHLNAMILAKSDEHLSHQPSIDYDSCFFCSHVVAVVHHVQLVVPEKLPIVKTILSNVCQLVPSKCSCDVVDEKFDDIVKWDNEGKRPHDICKLLGTCVKLQDEGDDTPAIADELKGVVVASQWPAGDESECAYCQFATTVAKVALEQYGADIRQVRAYADMICDMLGEDNPCHTYVKQMDFVIDSISKGMSSKAICVGLGFCPATVADREGDALAWILDDRSSRATSIDHLSSLDSSLMETLKEPLDTSSDSCFFCMQVAPVLEVAVAQDPSQIEKIRETADVICNMLPSNNQPKSICHDLRLCPMGSGSAMLDLAVPDMLAVQKRDEESTTCAYCSGVVTVLEHTLDQQPEQVNELREVTGHLCQLLPANDTIFDEAVVGLRSGKGPGEICQTLNLCTFVEERDESSGLVDFAGGDFLPTGCATCQQKTLLLASLIERPDSLATFEREISSVCRLIPGSGEHKDAIIDLLKKNEDVTAICTRIGQCPAVAKEEQEKSMSMGCLFCEFIADLVEHAKDRKKERKALSEVKATLETVCTILPPQARCDVLSSKFDELVSLMREGKSPSEACHAAALCDAEFVFLPASNSDEDPIVRSFEKALRGVGNVMEIE